MIRIASWRSLQWQPAKDGLRADVAAIPECSGGWVVATCRKNVLANQVMKKCFAVLYSTKKVHSIQVFLVMS